MERRTLETAAAKYSYLRGLLFIPVGVLIILAALSNWEVGPLRHELVFVAAALACGAVCVPIYRFYNDHYGRLRPSTRQQLRAGIVIGVGVAATLPISLLLRSRADWSLDLAVNVTAVCFASLMLVMYAVGVGLKAHHVIIWGALLVAGALPVWTGADPSNIGVVMAGVAVIVCGVFDHRLFVRTFGSPKVPALQNGNAGH